MCGWIDTHIMLRLAKKSKKKQVKGIGMFPWGKYIQFMCI